MMKVNKIFIIGLLLFLTCDSNFNYVEINVDDAIRVDSQYFIEQKKDILYAWSPPRGPDKSRALYVIHDDHMFFTPDVIGKYHIKLIIESMSNEKLFEENFYFLATELISGIKKNINIPYQNENTISDDKKTNTISKEMYAIQFSARKSHNAAQIDKTNLEDFGFDDLYIDPVNNLFRVRLGNISSKSIADSIATVIEKKFKLLPWVIKIK